MTMSLTLPLDTVTTLAEPTAGPGPKKRALLVVDDEEAVRQSLRAVFRDELQLQAPHRAG